ncbi:MAG: hypothetical protein QJT81_19660 [Candidatus Thiothrix putei]|uniref:Uncharacterized protein n=1 Tax=Candidatus Thiothrix putei TaxID=3080811 RepID=A0AA95KNY5_9GAMM|nr:MAG: hypothetical protein QJT81_19660 [Candidatus Thiothrix putei]
MIICSRFISNWVESPLSPGIPLVPPVMDVLDEPEPEVELVLLLP